MIKVVLGTMMILFASVAQAELAPIGCAVRTYDCFPLPNGSQKCAWGSDQGYLFSVDLQKTGSSPSYEIWEGKLNGSARQYKYEVGIYQRREPAKKVNYLTADLMVGDVKVSATGENTAEAKFLNTKTNEGIGIHCSMDITPAP